MKDIIPHHAERIGEIVVRVIACAGEHLSGLPAFYGEDLDGGDALAEPPHHGNGHAVAESLVARPIGAQVFAAPGDIGVIVGEALEALALNRGEPANCGCGDIALLLHPRLGCERANRLPILAEDTNLVAAVLGEGDGGHNPRVRMAAGVEALTAKGMGNEQAGTIKRVLILETLLVAERRIERGRYAGGPLAAFSAFASAGGSSLPRFSARRRIPLQAVALKKNRRGTSPVSKISDNEHATAPLWNSEVLSVQHSVGEPIPELDQPSEDGAKVPSSAAGQHAGDVLPHQPSGPCAISKPEKLERQVATVVSQSASKAGDAERLAGGSSDKKVNWPIFVGSDRREVAVQRDLRIVMLEDGSRERFDLAESSSFPTEGMPCNRGGFYSRADAEIPHPTSPGRPS
jgi:hypothetical protein